MVLKLRVWVLVLGLVPFGSSILVTSTAQAVPVHNAEPTANRGYIQFGLTPAPRKARPRKERVRGTVAPSSVPANVLCEAVGPTISTAPCRGDLANAARARPPRPPSIRQQVFLGSPPGADVVLFNRPRALRRRWCSRALVAGMTARSRTRQERSPATPSTDLADTEFAILLSWILQSTDAPLFQPANL